MNDMEKNNMKSAAVYISGPHDIDSLEPALQDHARECGYEPVEVYRDDPDVQGHPQLDRMLEEASERGVMAIVVNSLGDLARFPGQLVKVLGRLMELGVGLIAMEEGIDTTTIDTGVLLRVVKAVVDMQHRTMLSTVTQRRSNKAGRPETEVDVEEARRLRAAGLSFGQISSILKAPKGTIHSRLKK